MPAFRVWTSAHDNGWESWIAHTKDGIYMIWITGPSECLETQYQEDFGGATTDALFLLREHTGHECCTGCSRWFETAAPPRPR